MIVDWSTFIPNTLTGAISGLVLGIAGGTGLAFANRYSGRIFDWIELKVSRKKGVK
jgi:hypothetical protein